MKRKTRTGWQQPAEKASFDQAAPDSQVTLVSGNGQGVETQESRIRELAFRLYEQRGRGDGYDLQDWLEAEAIIQRNGRDAA